MISFASRSKASAVSADHTRVGLFVTKVTGSVTKATDGVLQSVVDKAKPLASCNTHHYGTCGKS